MRGRKLGVAAALFGLVADESGALPSLQEVPHAAPADGAAKPTAFALPLGFLARALELFEIGGSESAHAAAHPAGVSLETLDELGDPGVADA